MLALQAPCCGKFYACASCHDACEDHALEPWPADTPVSEPALMCGVCRHRYSIQTYIRGAKPPACPSCAAPMNPGCQLHWKMYFDQQLIDAAKPEQESEPEPEPEQEQEQEQELELEQLSAAEKQRNAVKLCGAQWGHSLQYALISTAQTQLVYQICGGDYALQARFSGKKPRIRLRPSSSALSLKCHVSTLTYL